MADRINGKAPPFWAVKKRRSKTSTVNDLGIQDSSLDFIDKVSGNELVTSKTGTSTSSIPNSSLTAEELFYAKKVSESDLQTWIQKYPEYWRSFQQDFSINPNSEQVKHALEYHTGIISTFHIKLNNRDLATASSAAPKYTPKTIISSNQKYIDKKNGQLNLFETALPTIPVEDFDPIGQAHTLTPDQYKEATRHIPGAPSYTQAKNASQKAQIKQSAAQEAKRIVSTTPGTETPVDFKLEPKKPVLSFNSEAETIADKFSGEAKDFVVKNKNYFYAGGLALGVVALSSWARAKAENKRSRPILDSDVQADAYLQNNGRRDGKIDIYSEFDRKRQSSARVMAPFFGWGGARTGRILKLAATNKQEQAQHSITNKPTKDVNMPSDSGIDRLMKAGNHFLGRTGIKLSTKTTHEDNAMSKRDVDEALARRMVHGRAF